MSKEIGITRMRLIMYGLAILVVAFLGMLLGNRYISKRQARAFEQQMDMLPHSTALLRDGDTFPPVELIGLDNMPANAISLIEGHKALIVMLSPGCEPCALVIDEWKGNADRMPSDLKIICIANIGPLQALKYWNDIGAPFPLYCDTAHMLSSVYGLEAYPTIIGIDDIGQIAFVAEGWREGFSPQDAYKLITKKQ